MKIAVWPADNNGCGNYRLRFPAEALAAQGADVVVDLIGPVVEWSQPWEGMLVPPPYCHALRFHQRYEADVVVMQRPARHVWREIIPLLHAQGTRVVVDIDDLFDGVEKTHVAHTEYNSVAVNHAYLDECCRAADLVTVSTPALLRRYGYGHGVVLPNLVPERYLNIWGLKRPDTVGWGGFVATHPGDLKSTEGGVAAALRGTDWGFRVVGSRDAVRAELGLEGEPECDGPVAFIEYAPAVAEFEIGIVPLADSPFNRAKSALKAIEYAATGVPVVMSSTPDNLRVNKLGIGLVAESRGQWKRHLSWLMGSADARYEMAERGREVMAGQTYEAHTDRYWSAWSGEGSHVDDRSPRQTVALSGV